MVSTITKTPNSSANLTFSYEKNLPILDFKHNN